MKNMLITGIITFWYEFSLNFCVEYSSVMMARASVSVQRDHYYTLGAIMSLVRGKHCSFVSDTVDNFLCHAINEGINYLQVIIALFNAFLWYIADYDTLAVHYHPRLPPQVIMNSLIS